MLGQGGWNGLGRGMERDGKEVGEGWQEERRIGRRGPSMAGWRGWERNYCVGLESRAPVPTIGWQVIVPLQSLNKYTQSSIWTVWDVGCCRVGKPFSLVNIIIGSSSIGDFEQDNTAPVINGVMNIFWKTIVLNAISLECLKWTVWASTFHTESSVSVTDK